MTERFLHVSASTVCVPCLANHHACFWCEMAISWHAPQDKELNLLEEKESKNVQICWSCNFSTCVLGSTTPQKLENKIPTTCAWQQQRLRKFAFTWRKRLCIHNIGCLRYSGVYCGLLLPWGNEWMSVQVGRFPVDRFIRRQLPCRVLDRAPSRTAGVVLTLCWAVLPRWKWFERM